MNRTELVRHLLQAAPKIFGVAFSEDMGYEFTALHSDGIVFAKPGMLVDISGGQLPPDEDLFDFMDQERFEITPWDEVDDETLIEFLEDIERL